MIQRKDRLTGMALAVLATLLWSGNFIIARGLYKTIGPVSLSFFRWSTATIVLLPIALRSFKNEWPLIRDNLKIITLTAFFGITLFNTFVYVAGHYTSATNLAIIGTTSSPIFVLIISSFVFKESIRWYQVIGAIICIAGILVLMSKGSIEQLSRFKFGTGDLWILAGALSFAIYTVLVRLKPKALSSISFLFALFLTGTLFLLPAFFIENSNGLSFTFSTQMLWVFLYLGVGTSVIAFLSWNIAIKKIGGPSTALFGNLIPAFSTLEAVLILNENFNAVIAISLVILFCGIVVANSGWFFPQKSSQVER
jgi:drug/metabolite transporter (DMT)-like permease